MVRNGDIIRRILRSGLKYNSVQVSDLDGRVDVRVNVPGTDFEQMTVRRTYVDPERMRKGLQSDGGHIFANMGVSTVITMFIEDGFYLVLEDQPREGKPNVLKNISGYVEETQSRTPNKAADKEIVEELLLLTRDENIMRIKRKNKVLPNPYKSHLKSYKPPIMYTKASHFDFFGLERKVFIDGEKAKRRPKVAFHAPTNNLQLLYGGNLNFMMEHRKALVRFGHTREFVGGHYLEVTFQEQGIVLAKLKKGKLTGELYELRHGDLVEINPGNRSLSDAFAQNDGYITLQPEIGFREYVDRQESVQGLS